MSIYGWGSGKYGAFLDETKKVVHTPIELFPSDSHDNIDSLGLADDKIVSIAAGDGHSLVATTSGDVYAFGRNNFGQLGCFEDEGPRLKKILSLHHKKIVKVAAGSNSSFAVTDLGQVYRFGLIHVAAHQYEEDHTSVLEGRMVGMTDGNTVRVEVDTEARAARSSLISPSQLESINVTQYEARELSNIVLESSTRWMIDAADSEYHTELRALGYTKEESEEVLQERGREYHGMLKIGCKREPSSLPILIRSPLLAQVHIHDVACGHAHFMLLSTNGFLFAAGYNDRGQLGLGHRIGTSDVKQVHKLDDYFVLQVTCGQQHTMCRALPRSLMSYDQNIDTTFSTGADVFVWGNGILGQLGGGRLVPTLQTYLADRHPADIIDIACGDNFSVAVTGQGLVYSWGHSEYNQHGQGYLATSDYTDPYHYFTPRQVEGVTPLLGRYEQVIQVQCGANFTVARTNLGNILSWGWSDHGALGRGKGLVSSEPSMLFTLGQRVEDRCVRDMAVGSSHVIVSTEIERNRWASSHFTSFLSDSILSSTADLVILLEDGCTHLLAHASMLGARSRYLRGLLEQASLYQNKQDCKISIYLPIPVSDVDILKSLLVYLYTDRVVITGFEKRRRLGKLGIQLGVMDLEYLYDEHQRRTPSTFRADMLNSISNSKMFHDVFFYTLHQGERICVFSAHKWILAHFLKYFHPIFYNKSFSNANSSDNSNDIWICMDLWIEEGITPSIFMKIVNYAYCGFFGLDDVDNRDQTLADEVEDSMAILMTANRFGFTIFTDKHELKLFSFFKNHTENVHILKDFANTFSFHRLELKCDQVLQMNSQLRST